MSSVSTVAIDSPVTVIGHPFANNRPDVARTRSRKYVIRDAMIAAGSLGVAPWLLQPNQTGSRDFATQIAVPGAAGEIGRPEMATMDHLIVISHENRLFHYLLSLRPVPGSQLAHIAGGAHPSDE
jgi:hypothetical protein